MQDHPAQRRTFGDPKLTLAALIFAGALVMLFARLGHYALWDDEAGTALSAIGIWRTGDTTAVLDHNLVAYGSGKDLRNLHERLMPPLPGYLAAPFLGLLGRNAGAARLPFAVCGAACVALMLGWVWKRGTRPGTLLFFGVALLTNVSFFLFFRQCRYYGLAMLCSVALAWLYVNFSGRRWQVVCFAALSFCLFASNYLNWAALYLCLAADYLLWGRKQFRLRVSDRSADLQSASSACGHAKPTASRRSGGSLRPSDWAILILPQVVLGGAVFLIWNPLLIFESAEKFPEVGKLLHVWWCARDIAVCEFVSPALVALGLALYFSGRERNSWLLRGCVCLALYVVVVGLLEPRPPSLRGVAFVRYFTPLIPLGIAISALALSGLYRRSRWAAVALAAGALGTNLLNGGPLLSRGLRSTPADYVGELIHPPGDPFTVTADWIEEHVPERAAVWVVPDYATYPLMFHAPKPTYAWQLIWPPAKDEFRQLPPVHFIGRVAPECIIAFGPATELARESIASWKRPEIQYVPVATIDFFWKDGHRPELFWRTFQPITGYDRQTEAIYVFKLRPGQAPPPAS